jgi:catechol 2,3-dioxygenase-like lactoylglutathione lyase family enzyme
MRFATLLALCASGLAVCAPALPETPAADPGKVIGLEFVGRMVGDLDRSVAFYKALGFSQDPLANPAWRRDEVTEHLYGIKQVETRMAKMYVVNSTSGQHFVVYLRELRGLPRRNLSDHTAWDPGASHFGLIVADAQQTWSQLQSAGLLHARSWGGQLIAPPGQTKGMLAYMTDPDGLDIELIDQRPAAPAESGRPARPALLPGVNHVGLVVLDSDKARAFYTDLLGGKPLNTESPWLKGDFYDSAVGGHGNILRFFNEQFADATAPATAHLSFELVEFQNRKKPVVPASITDIGVGYVGFEVQGLDGFLGRVKAAGGRMVSSGIVTMRTGTRVVMVRDPDVGGFAELFEQPKKPTTAAR